jgi:hypothetical protein
MPSLSCLMRNILLQYINKLVLEMANILLFTFYFILQLVCSMMANNFSPCDALY